MLKERIISLRSTPLPSKQKWTRPQRRFLELLQNPEYLRLSREELCQLAGYRTKSAWQDAIIDEHFVAAVKALGHHVKKKPSTVEWTPTQRKLLAALEHEENRQLPIQELCRRADVCYRSWNRCIKDPHFVETVQALGVPAVRQWAEAHLEVSLAADPQEELSKDVWDMRRLNADYPKHNSPSDFIVDFTWIVNPLLRQQVKNYFRQHLTRWKARTFRAQLFRLKPVLSLLPPEIHITTLTRQHLERLLPRLTQQLGRSGNEYICVAKAMFRYMATAAAWTGPRPPRFLIWDEEVPAKSKTLPRPIPPAVIDQLDDLLQEAVRLMEAGQAPRILPPSGWNALLILRRTGMRYEDLAHLKAPDEHDRNGCLDQDSEGYWWIRLSYKVSKANRDHRIPTKLSDGVVAAVRRQRERVRLVTDHYGEHYLFRTERGLLTLGGFKTELRKLASYLTYEGQPYSVSPHQFRHTIATDMIEQGVDIYTVKEYFGAREYRHDGEICSGLPQEPQAEIRCLPGQEGTNLCGGDAGKRGRSAA